MCRVKQNIFIKCILSRLSNLCRQGGKRIIRARGDGQFQRISVFQTQLEDAYMNSEQKTCRGSSYVRFQHRNMCGGNRCRLLSFSKKLFAIDLPPSKGKIQFSPVKCHWICKPHFWGGLRYGSIWLTKNNCIVFFGGWGEMCFLFPSVWAFNFLSYRCYLYILIFL